jgi:hypothetical protein
MESINIDEMKAKMGNHLNACKKLFEDAPDFESQEKALKMYKDTVYKLFDVMKSSKAL